MEEHKQCENYCVQIGYVFFNLFLIEVHLYVLYPPKTCQIQTREMDEPQIGSLKKCCPCCALKTASEVALCIFSLLSLLEPLVPCERIRWDDLDLHHLSSAVAVLQGALLPHCHCTGTACAAWETASEYQ